MTIVMTVTSASPTSSSSETAGGVTSLERTQALRLQALVEAGYPPALAYAIARRGSDLRLALGLARAGCPVRLAAQLVA